MRRLFGLALFATMMACGLGARAEQTEFDPAKVSDSLKAIFQRDERYEGVRRINIYLLRLLYILMFFVLGRDAWTQERWRPPSSRRSSAARIF